MREISPELVAEVRDWLGADGIAFFRTTKEKHGRVDAVYAMKIGNGRSIPYAVHFHEGMQLRNFMRETGLCEDWTTDDFDNDWIAVAEACISEKDVTVAVVEEPNNRTSYNGAIYKKLPTYSFEGSADSLYCMPELDGKIFAVECRCTNPVGVDYDSNTGIGKRDGLVIQWLTTGLCKNCGYTPWVIVPRKQ